MALQVMPGNHPVDPTRRHSTWPLLAALSLLCLYLSSFRAIPAPLAPDISRFLLLLSIFDVVGEPWK